MVSTPSRSRQATRISLPDMVGPTSARDFVAGVLREDSLRVLFMFFFGCGRRRGETKNPRPFPAVGSCRNSNYRRQAPTASCLTTTTRTTCRRFPDIAETVSAVSTNGQAGFRIFPAVNDWADVAKKGEPHGNRLDFEGGFSASSAMGLPSQPVTLTVQQIDELNKKLAKLRHDVNNNLSLMIAAAELVQFKPDMAAQMANTLMEQPQKIGAAMAKFSEDFETLFGITK